MTGRKVLVPLDRSDYSLKIVPEIQKFIPAADTQITLFYVADPVTSIGTVTPVYDADFLIPEPTPTPSLERMPHPIYANQVEESLQNTVKDDLSEKGELIF